MDEKEKMQIRFDLSEYLQKRYEENGNFLPYASHNVFIHAADAAISAIEAGIDMYESLIVDGYMKQEDAPT